MTMTAGAGGSDFTSSDLADTLTGGAGIDDLTGGSGSDTITGGAGNDILDGGIGADTVSGGAGDDTIDGGANADSLSGGAGDDTFTMDTQADTVVATVLTDASTGAAMAGGATFAAGDVITFGNGLDIITDFTAGDTNNDQINVNAASAAATTGIGVAHDDLDAATGAIDLLFLSGNYVASTGKFTIAADGVGADTLIIDADVNGDIDVAGDAGVFLLQGVDSDDLIAGDFI